MDGKTEEKGLCSTCAIKYLENKDAVKNLCFVDQKLMTVIEEMRDLLSGIISNISEISIMMQEKENPNSKKCENCGITFDNFRETGYLGCPYCYHSFNEQIKEFILEIERGSIHKGKMPKKYAELFLLKKEITYLKNQLKKLVLDENYEKADKIKRKLEKLIGNYKIGKQDEIH